MKITAYCDCDGDEPKSSSVSTVIRFISKDSEPYFITNVENREFTENTTGETETAVLPKASYNDDGEEWANFPVYYHIWSDSSDCFQINLEEPILSLKCLLDREAEDSHIVEVVASRLESGNNNPNQKSILTVHIKVMHL